MIDPEPKSITAAEDILGTVCLVIVFVTMLAAVFFRYVLNDSLIWSEELARYGLILLTFLGVATGFRRGSHVRIEALEQKLGRHAPKLTMFNLIASLAFIGFLIWQAIGISKVLSASRSAALGLPMSWLYLAVAAALALAVFRVIQTLIKLARSQSK